MRREAVFESLALAGCSDRELRALMRDHADAATLWNKLDDATLREIGTRSDRRPALLSRRDKLDPAAVEKRMDATGATWILADGSGWSPYPETLANLSSPPAVLRVRGALPDRMLAIVGSRKATEYSRRILERFVPVFVAAGYATVSGGAYGVDTLVHELTLRAGGRTVAVLGTGIDRCYPVSNRDLFDRIVSRGGALVSQFPLGTPGEAFRFPVRNETIAALGAGTLVTEAAESSGSLITARLALDLGREVFAVPGDIFRENSLGTDGLIARWEAACVRSAEEILALLESRSTVPARPSSPVTTDPAAAPADLSTPEGRILASLIDAPLSADDLSERLGIDAPILAGTLAMMELDGAVTRTPTGTYRRMG